MIRVIKRFAALTVMVAVALLSGSAWGWNAKRTLSSLKTLTTPEARGNYLVQSINDAANNDWLEIPTGVEYMTFPSCVTISKNLKLTYADSSGRADLYGGNVCRHFRVTGGPWNWRTFGSMAAKIPPATPDRSTSLAA